MSDNRNDRPAGCCGVCPEVGDGGYDCTCASNPRCPKVLASLWPFCTDGKQVELLEKTAWLRAVKAEAWDEGYSYLFDTQQLAALNNDDIVVTSLDDNPYLDKKGDKRG